jgi:hypothetical protein
LLIIQATIKGVSSVILISSVISSLTSLALSSNLAFYPESASRTYIDALNDVDAAADIN